MVRGLAVAVAGVMCLVGSSGCGFVSQGCTDIGVETGVRVTVEADAAPVRALRLRVCPEDRECRSVEVSIYDEEPPEHPSCVGEAPIGGCATPPDVGQEGFADVPLPPGPVTVSGSYRAGGRVVQLAEITVDAEEAYPNGRDCGAAGTQARVTIDASGLR